MRVPLSVSSEQETGSFLTVQSWLQDSVELQPFSDILWLRWKQLILARPLQWQSLQAWVEGSSATMETHAELHTGTTYRLFARVAMKKDRFVG